MPSPPSSLSTEMIAFSRPFHWLPLRLWILVFPGISCPHWALSSPFYSTVLSDSTCSCGFSFLLNEAATPWQSQRSLHVMSFCLTFSFISLWSTPHYSKMTALLHDIFFPQIRLLPPSVCVFIPTAWNPIGLTLYPSKEPVRTSSFDVICSLSSLSTLCLPIFQPKCWMQFVYIILG